MADHPPETEEALELLDELILKGRLNRREQEALRFTAVLQISAHAATRLELQAEDHALLALLLGRWGFALTDWDESDIDELSDAFPVTLMSLACSLQREPEAIARSLERLAAASLIGLDPPPRDGTDTCAVDFLSVLIELAPALARLLWREFVEREGYGLSGTATHYFDSIAESIEELREFRPSCPQLRMLRDDYRAFKARTSVDALMKRWHDEPAAFYAFLKALADFEDRFAILSGTLTTGLQAELADRASKRVLIVGRCLAPSAAPANAA